MAERTADLEQRNAELILINGVQQALAAQLGFESIYDLVCDKIFEIFDAHVVDIGIYDRASGLVYGPYWIERGIRHSTKPSKPRGFYKYVLDTGQTLVVNSDMAHARVLYDNPIGTFSGDPAQSVVVAPLTVGSDVRGFISLQDLDREQAFSEADVRLLGTLAASMSVAIENARLFDETRRRADEMAALAEIGRDISATLDLPTVLERIATHAKDLLHGRDVVLRLLEPDGSMPAVVALGKYAEIYKHWQVQLGYGLTGHIAHSGVAEIVNDPPHDPRVAHIPGTEADNATEAMIFAPLLVAEKVIGVMTVWRDKTIAGPFDQADLDFTVGLARQAAIAIENARLFAEIQRQKQFFEALIEACPVAIIPEDLNERVTAWNPAAEALFGYTREEAIGRHIDDLVANRPDIRQDADRYTRATFNGKAHGIVRRTRSGEHLLNLINDVLEISKIEAGQITLNEAPFDLRALLRSVEELFRLRAESKQLRLRFEVAPDVPQYAIGDESKLRQILINLLGNAVKFTQAGELALMVAQHAAPDLILLDIQMPGLDGFEVCKRLKEHNQTRDIPVIFISALDDVLDKVEAFEVGGADYISKPFQILEVLARVEHQLRLHRQRATLAAANALARRLQSPVDQLVASVEQLAGGSGAPASAEQIVAIDAIARTIQSDLLELARLTG